MWKEHVNFRFMSGFVRILFQEVTRRVLENAVAIISPSAATRDDIVKLLAIDPRKITVIPMGIDAVFDSSQSVRQQAAETVREKYQLSSSARYVLYVGSCRPQKNVANLLRAMEEIILSDESDIELLLCGTRSDDRFFQAIEKELLQSKIQSRCRFIDNPDDGDMLGLYSIGAALVYPSIHEGFGMPPLEAAKCSLPIVASEIEVLKEVIGEANAIWVDHHSPTDIA